MEHVVQFGINIDDTAIAEAVKRDAYKEVIKQLTDEARKALPMKYKYGCYGNRFTGGGSTVPTNDERREVARRLRDNAGQKPSWVIPWAVFNDAYEHEGAELINRLADLIEPEERTCHVEHIDDDSFHLSCGHEAAGCVSPSFCPYCGARVEEGE